MSTAQVVALPAPAVLQGCCYGFAVRSPLSFSLLRAGGGDELTIVEGRLPPATATAVLLKEWRSAEPGGLGARLFADRSAFRMAVEGAGCFGIDPELGRIVLPPAADPVRRETRLWGIPALLCFLHRGDLPLHAAAVEVDGKAVVLGAPSRSGKTTLAAAFMGAGHRLLAEDLTCVRLQPRPAVVPGPAMLRLRPDVADRLDLRSACCGGGDSDRVQVTVPPAIRGDCAPVPLGAVVMLREGRLGLQRVAATEALRDIWALSFRLQTGVHLARSFAALADLVAAVPVWDLRRPLTFRALPATVRAVERLILDDRPNARS